MSKQRRIFPLDNIQFNAKMAGNGKFLSCESPMFFKTPKNTSPKNPTSPEPSYVARDTSFEGNIICDGEIHIDGAVRGTVRAETCLIDSHGELHGELTAQNVFVRGRVFGPITGAHVTIQAGAHVEGNITHETISIENGAYVYGSMRQGGMHANEIQPRPVPVAALDTAFSKTGEVIALDEAIENIRPHKKTKS